MDQLFTQAPYAEDQRYAHSILALHVVGRGLSTGAVLGVLPSVVSRLTRRPLPLFKCAAIGSLLGGVGLSIALGGLMRGKDEIEWQDRSWRLLGNAGQNATDLTTFGGSVAGAVVGALYRPAGVSLMWRLLGGASLGNAVGLAAGMSMMKKPD